MDYSIGYISLLYLLGNQTICVFCSIAILSLLRYPTISPRYAYRALNEK